MDHAQEKIAVARIAVVQLAVVQLAVQPAHQDDAEMDIQAAGNEDKEGAVVQEARLEVDLVQMT